MPNSDERGKTLTEITLSEFIAALNLVPTKNRKGKKTRKSVEELFAVYHDHSYVRGDTFELDSPDAKIPAVGRTQATREVRPPDLIRFDHIDHIISVSKERKRCKQLGCLKLTNKMCVKCNVHLCLKKRKCFYKFHGRFDAL